MRALRILCGVAVLLNSLHLVHAIHHFYTLWPHHDAAFWAGTALAVVIDCFSFVGGYFLLRPGR